MAANAVEVGSAKKHKLNKSNSWLQKSVPINGGVATLLGFTERGEPIVDLEVGELHEGAVAVSCVPLESAMIGRQVVVVRLEGPSQPPVIMGVIRAPCYRPAGLFSRPRTGQQVQRIVEIDGDRVVFTAQTEIVLRCGPASITLTKAGKVLIRGAYLLSRSSGANMIKGGSVELN